MLKMPKEAISPSQAFCLLVLFLFGSSALFNINDEVGQDSWISLLLGLVFALPIILLYSRLIKLFPGKDLFEIMKILFGKIAGRALIALMSWYALHLSALVLRNFSEFIKITVMFETPQLAIMIVMLLAIVYMAKSGIETMGRWSLIIMPIVSSVILLTVVLSINKLDINNIRPFMEHSFGAIASNAFRFFSFPFAETVILLCIAGSFKRKESPYKLYMYSSFCGAAVLLIVILRNILLLNTSMGMADSFPSFTAVSVVEAGGFLARVEGSIATNLILAGIVKITACLVAAAKGTASLFGIQNYKSMISPIAVLSIALSLMIFRNTIQMVDFLDIYPFYAIPFQIIIPLLIWVVGEIKVHRMRAKDSKEIP